MKWLRELLGLCAHDWKKTNCSKEYYSMLFGYVWYDVYECTKCNKIKEVKQW